MSHNKLRGNESGCILEPGSLPSSRLFPATHLLLTAAAPQSLYTGDSCLWHFDYSLPALQRFFLENIFHLDKLCVDLLKRSVEPIGKFGLATDAVFPPTAVALLSGRSFFWEEPVPAATSTQICILFISCSLVTCCVALQREEAECNMNNTDDATRRLNRFFPLLSLFPLSFV